MATKTSSLVFVAFCSPKMPLMFTHQVARSAGFLSDSTSTISLCGLCASSDPRLDRGERARHILMILLILSKKNSRGFVLSLAPP